jgi:hypothetical protein
MHDHPPADADERAILLEERASRLRVAMLRDAKFVAGIREGQEEAERGDVMTLPELRRRLEID